MLLGIATLLSGFVTVLFGLDYLLDISIPIKLSFAAPYVSDVFWTSIWADCILVIGLLVKHSVESRALALMASACAIIWIIAMAPLLDGRMSSGYATALAWMVIVAFFLMLVFGIAACINWWRLPTEPSNAGEQMR